MVVSTNLPESNRSHIGINSPKRDGNENIFELPPPLWKRLWSKPSLCQTTLGHDRCCFLDAANAIYFWVPELEQLWHLEKCSFWNNFELNPPGNERIRPLKRGTISKGNFTALLRGHVNFQGCRIVIFLKVNLMVQILNWHESNNKKAWWCRLLFFFKPGAETLTDSSRKLGPKLKPHCCLIRWHLYTYTYTSMYVYTYMYK